MPSGKVVPVRKASSFKSTDREGQDESRGRVSCSRPSSSSREPQPTTSTGRVSCSIRPSGSSVPRRQEGRAVSPERRNARPAKHQPARVSCSKAVKVGKGEKRKADVKVEGTAGKRRVEERDGTLVLSLGNLDKVAEDLRQRRCLVVGCSVRNTFQKAHAYKITFRGSLTFGYPLHRRRCCWDGEMRSNRYSDGC